jgi:hypothetical protein
LRGRLPLVEYCGAPGSTVLQRTTASGSLKNQKRH